MSTDARSSILQRIRRALPASEKLDPELAAREWQELPRNYQLQSCLSATAMWDRLEHRLRDYDAEVQCVREQDIATTITSVLAERGNPATLLPRNFPPAWIASGAPFTLDNGFSSRELDRFEAVVTAATLAIAETGTLVLQSVNGQGRRAVSLVPDFHLCIVRAEDVVESVPEAFARLARTSTLPTTFISGPSATADIEMTRIKGVHGPRFLHVLLVVG